MTDDIETIVEAFRLLNSDDYERSLQLVADDFEMVTTADLASEPDTYRGPDGVRRWWETFLESMEWVRLETHSVEMIDASRGIVAFEIHARGRASGIETSQKAWSVVATRDGQITRMGFFTSPEQARAAAEPPPS